MGRAPSPLAIRIVNDSVAAFGVPPPAGEFAWFPAFVYFNVYAMPRAPGVEMRGGFAEGPNGEPREVAWIRTLYRSHCEKVQTTYISRL